MSTLTPVERRDAGLNGILRWIGRAGVLLFCTAYLFATAWFGVRHVLGDSLSHPGAYFFTWDMFPGYVTETSRRMVVGHTWDGRFVKLLPENSHRFRWGIHNDVSRVDIDRNPRNLERAIERSVGEYNRAHAKSPIESVLVVEQYWPSRFNLPDDLYRQSYGEANPRRRYWRFIDVPIDIDAVGRISNPSVQQCRISNDECRMNDEFRNPNYVSTIRHSEFVIRSSFGYRHSSFAHGRIGNPSYGSLEGRAP